MSATLKKLSRVKFLEFSDLFDPAGGVQVVIVNYLAILELAKEGLIRMTQAMPFAPIYVQVSSFEE